MKATSAVPPSVQRLIDSLAALPGIGPKTASRLTYHLLRVPEAQTLELAAALADLRKLTRYCDTCFNFSQTSRCQICDDDGRDHSTLCVVEEPLDVLAIERTGVYGGLYHVLHGAISPIEGVGPDDLKISELVHRVSAGAVNEVIVATNATLEGEATAMYLHKRLADLPVRTSRLARGLPSGGDLEYVDPLTLSRALEGRLDMD